MQYRYKTRGTCSQYIDFELDENGVLTDLKFLGGCNGNLQGISRLAIGRTAAELADVLKGVNCNGRGTSCPDQLAIALLKAMEEVQKQ